MAKKKNAPCTEDACPIEFNENEQDDFVMTEETKIELSNNRGEDDENE